MRRLALLVVACAFIHQGDGRELKCYYCVDKCHYPLEVHKCSDDKYMCFSSFTTIGGETVEQKGCVLKHDSDVISTCEELDEMRGSSCFTCQTNFCNSAESYSFAFFYISSLFCLGVFLQI
ncbi:unnamed protein product [Tenebrio molitor]|nr:unnamed protein product [Tenebrio molitor]